MRELFDQSPVLLNGDRLTRAEFERRYSNMPHLRTAELVEGIVRIPPPRELARLSGQRADLIAWLGTFAAFTSGVEAGAHATVRLDATSEMQPVGTLLVAPGLGGQVQLDAEGYIDGAPELVADVVAPSATFEIREKQEVYRRNNVREYIVWRVQDRIIDWFVQRQSQFERLQTDASGVYRSQVFPGLWLDAAAMLRGDMATVLGKLHEGITSPEHAAFVVKLQEEFTRRHS